MGAESFASAVGPSELEGASSPRAGVATSHATGLPRKQCMLGGGGQMWGLEYLDCLMHCGLQPHKGAFLSIVAQLGLKSKQSCCIMIEV